MTAVEHQLIVMALARQAMVIKALSNALVNRGYLEKDDVPAFGALLDNNDAELLRTVQMTEDLYKGIAHTLKLETGL